MFYRDVHPFLKWLAVTVIIQPMHEDKMCLIISFKPRLVGFGVPDATVKSWTPLKVYGTPEEIETKMNQQWIISQLSQATEVVQQAEASKADKPADTTGGEKKKTTRKAKEEPVVPRPTPDEQTLIGMVVDAEKCLKEKDRAAGLEVFQQRIRPLFDRIKESMNADLKKRTIDVATAIVNLPQQMEIPQ